MRQLIAGNWKMNGLLGQPPPPSQAPLRQGGADGLACHDLLVFARLPPLSSAVGAAISSSAPPSPWAVRTATQGLRQRCPHRRPLRPHAARGRRRQLGHPRPFRNRRADHHETDAQIRAKTLAAIAAGLTPIVCVGETEAQRNAGQANAIVGAQLAGSLPEDFAGVVAYEPVWAIGHRASTATENRTWPRCTRISGHACAACWASAAGHLRILYGGSDQTSGNAASAYGGARERRRRPGRRRQPGRRRLPRHCQGRPRVISAAAVAVEKRVT